MAAPRTIVAPLKGIGDAKVVGGSFRMGRGDGSGAPTDAPYLTRTNATEGNRRTWTFSGWVKRTRRDNSQTYTVINYAYTATASSGIEFGSPANTGYDNKIRFNSFSSGNNMDLWSAGEYTNTDGWYHIMQVYDSTQSTDSNRVKMYINGEHITDWAAASYPANRWPSQWAEGPFCDDGTPGGFIGAYHWSGNDSQWMGTFYASEFYLLDGQALGPENFGYTDPKTNTWRPKKKYEAKAPNRIGKFFSANYAASDSFQANAPKLAAFDGGLTSRSACSSSGCTVTVSSMDVEVKQGLRIYAGYGSATVNGGSAVDFSSSAVGWQDLSFTGSLATIAVTGNAGGGNANAGEIYAIEVDGVILVDNGGYGTTGFYLPFDGSAPVGEDQSGAGNHWTPKNIGDSGSSFINTLGPSAVAAPILNTMGNGGHTPTPDAFGRKEDREYNVTVSGGKFVIGGTSQGTLPLLRGATYTFNQNDSSNATHPIRLSSTSDGTHNSGSAYSDGVRYSGTPGTSTYYGVEFDGDDYLSGTGPFTSHADYTIDMWIKFITFPSSNNAEAIFDTGSGNNDPELNVFNSGGTNILYDSLSSGTDWTGEALQLNKWYYIKQTIDGSSASDSSAAHKLFVNGVQCCANTVNLSNRTGGSSTAWAIAARTNGTVHANCVIQSIRYRTVVDNSTEIPLGILPTDSDTVLLCCQSNTVTTATTNTTGASITSNGDPTAVSSGLMKGAKAATQIVVPHNAPDNLYYYCSAHSGMGGTLTVSTDVTKADPYAWKCVCAWPGTATGIFDQTDRVNPLKGRKQAITYTSITNSKLSALYGKSCQFGTSTGNNHAVIYPPDPDWVLGTGSFTIEMWIYSTTASGTQNILQVYQNSSSNYYGMGIWSGYLDMYLQAGTANNLGAMNIGDSKWHHLAYVRDADDGNKIYCFVDGVNNKLGVTDATNLSDTAATVYIGRHQPTNNAFVGNIQDFRIYKGAAKYTKNFNPISAYPLLVSDSPSGGSFENAALKKPTNGSVYFNGSNNSINFGTHAALTMDGDFTIECFWHSGKSSAAVNFFSIGDSKASTGMSFYIGSSGTLFKFFTNDSVEIQDTNYYSGEWVHVALVRKGTDDNNTKMYINGRCVGYATNNADFAGDAYCGAEIYNSATYDDNLQHISNLRVTIDEAVYEDDFDPPTDPLTLTSQGATAANVQILCCQDPDSVSAVTKVPGAPTFTAVFPSLNNPFCDIDSIAPPPGNYTTLNPQNERATSNSGCTDGNLVYKNPNSNSAYSFVGMTNSTIRTDDEEGYYFEVTNLAAGEGGNGWALIDNTVTPYGTFDILTTSYPVGNASGNSQQGVSFISNGYVLKYGTNVNTGKTWSTAGDVSGVAIKGNNVWFHANGDWISGDPNTNASPSYTWATGRDIQVAWNGIGANGTAAGTWSQRFNFGQYPYKYVPPLGFKPLNTQTKGPTLPRPDQNFVTTIYTGNGTDGRIVTTGIEADLILIKRRSFKSGGSAWIMLDTVRGASNEIYPSTSGMQYTDTSGMKSFTNYGFTTGDGYVTNSNSSLYVSYNWKAGGSSNTFNVDGYGHSTAALAGLTGGDITPTGASVNTKLGISIIRYTSGADGDRVPHGLGATPDILFTKVTSEDSQNWSVYTTLIDGSYDYGRLNSNQLFANSGQTAYNATTFPNIHGSGKTVINYLWRSIPGFSKFGMYDGNGNGVGEGPYVDLGFRPSLLIIKSAVSWGGNWIVYDDKRDPDNPVSLQLYLNLSDEDTSAAYVNITATGFQIVTNNDTVNNSDDGLLYMAWAQQPGGTMWGGQSNAF